MSELLNILTVVFSSLGFIQMLIILVGDKIHNDYYISIMHPDGRIDVKAQTMFMFFVLSFVSLCLKEGIDYYNELYPPEEVSSESGE